MFREPPFWLLRFSNRIRFFPVSGEELVEARAAFPHGRYPLRIEEGRFTLREARHFSPPTRTRLQTSNLDSKARSTPNVSAGAILVWTAMSPMRT